MGSYFATGNYSDYSAQGNWNWGNNPRGSQLPPEEDAPLLPASTAARKQTATQPAEKKEGGIAGFFKGIVKGAVNSVKSLFTPQGLLMAGAVLGLVWLTGGAILPFLAVMGMGMGGMQMLKGAQAGDSEAVGEGFFTFASSAVGMKTTPASVTVGEGAAAETYTMAGSKAGESAGFMDQLKAPLGFTKYKSASGESLNMYSLAWKKGRSRLGGLRNNSAATSELSEAASGEETSQGAGKLSGAKEKTTASSGKQAPEQFSTEQEARLKSERARQQQEESNYRTEQERQRQAELQRKKMEADQAKEAELAQKKQFEAQKAREKQMQEQKAREAELAKQKREADMAHQKQPPPVPTRPNELGVSDGSVQLTKLPSGKVQLTRNNTINRFVTVDNRPVMPNSAIQLEPGNMVQVDNRLFKVTPNRELFKVSDDAALAHELFPNGLNNVTFRQGRVGDCSKLSEMQSLVEDPSGKGTRAVLSRISRTGDDGYQIKFGNGQTIRLKGNKFARGMNGKKYFVNKNFEQSRAAQGDLGIQVLERAYYRSLKEEMMPQKFTYGLGPRDPYTGAQQPILIRRPKTLSSELFHAVDEGFNHKYSHDFATRLLGDEWKPVIVDGLHDAPSARSAYGPSFAQRYAQTNYDPMFRVRMESVFEQVEHSPESARISAYTRAGGGDRVQLPLGQGRQLFANHSYYLKGISRDPSGNRVFNLINPHNSRDTMRLSEPEFMNNFSLLNGVKHQSYGFA